MRELPYPFQKGLLGGLRPFIPSTPGNEMLVECHNWQPSETGLIPHERICGITFSFFPAVLEVSITIVDDNDTIEISTAAPRVINANVTIVDDDDSIEISTSITTASFALLWLEPFERLFDYSASFLWLEPFERLFDYSASFLWLEPYERAFSYSPTIVWLEQWES